MIKELIDGLKNNEAYEISEKINMIEKMYADFIKLIEKKKYICQENYKKRQNIIKICNAPRSSTVDCKKIKRIDINIEKKNFNRNLSTNQKKNNKFKIGFRCLYIENGNYICNEIPSVKIERDQILFSCIKHHIIKKNAIELMKLLLNNKLFRIIFDNKNNKKCPIHKNELLIDCCLKCWENFCKECIKLNRSCKKGKEHKFFSNNIYLLLKNIKKKYKRFNKNKERLIKLINK